MDRPSTPSAGSRTATKLSKRRSGGCGSIKDSPRECGGRSLVRRRNFIAPKRAPLHGTPTPRRPHPPGRGGTRCGFGFMFESNALLPRPRRRMVACDREARILAVGKGVFELTGFRKGELIGKK